MPTITYDHSAGATVWVLTEDCGVFHGTVIRFRAEALITETKQFYDIRLDHDPHFHRHPHSHHHHDHHHHDHHPSGSDEFLPSKVFAEADLALAIAAYQATLT